MNNPLAVRIALLQQEILAIKKDFEVFIKDTTIPLEERWSTWKAAPNDMKRSDSWTTHFKALPCDWIMYDGNYHADRYQTVYMIDVVDAIEDNLAHPNEWNKEYRATLEEFGFSLDALKEEILEFNLGSFCYDW